MGFAAGRAALQSLKAEAARLREENERLEKQGKQTEKEIQQIKAQGAQAQARNVPSVEVGSFRFFAYHFEDPMDHTALRIVADGIRKVEPEAIIFLADVQGFCAASSGAIAQAKGVGANKLLARANELAGGKSGGRPEMAMGRLDHPACFTEVRGGLIQFIEERAR